MDKNDYAPAKRSSSASNALELEEELQMAYHGLRFETVKAELIGGVLRTILFAGLGAIAFFMRSSETETGNRNFLLFLVGVAAFLIVLMGGNSIQEIRRIQKSRK